MKENGKFITLIGVALMIILGIWLYIKTDVYQVYFYNEQDIYQIVKTRRKKPMKEPEKPEKDGYIFIGWYTEEGELFDFDSNINGNLNLIAHWGQVVTE